MIVEKGGADSDNSHATATISRSTKVTTTTSMLRDVGAGELASEAVLDAIRIWLPSVVDGNAFVWLPALAFRSCMYVS